MWGEQVILAQTDTKVTKEGKISIIDQLLLVCQRFSLIQKCWDDFISTLFCFLMEKNLVTMELFVLYMKTSKHKMSKDANPAKSQDKITHISSDSCIYHFLKLSQGNFLKFTGQ